MGLFGKRKVNVVVKKRTPDITPFTIYTMESNCEKKHVEPSKAHGVSPITGRDENEKITPIVESHTPVDKYDYLRPDHAKKTGIDSDDPYPEFRKVTPKYNPGGTTVVVEDEPKEEEKVAVEETPTVEEVQEELETVEEEKVEEKADFFTYEEDKETDSKFDKTLFSDLFGIDTKKEEKKKVYNENNLNDDASTSLFGDNPTSTEDEYEEEEEVVKPVVQEEIKVVKEEKKPDISYANYKLPSLDLLPDPQFTIGGNEEWNNNNIAIINQTLTNFRIDGQVKEYTEGPTFTRYAIMLGPGVPGSKISNISLDIQRSLAVPSIRIENPIPGKPYVGIEVPNKKRRTVTLKELICTEEFMKSKDPLLIPVGLDVEGNVKYVSIADFPHGLIAGSSGSGKSVFLSCMLVSLLYKCSPEILRFFFIDPKQVDLSQFEGVPHLISPIVTDVKDGISSLKWLLDEMERRFSVFRPIGGITKLKEYNEYCETHKEYKKIPYIVAVIDEAADFLLNAGNEAQDLITKLVQKSRAAGIHLILAMQKPVSKILSTTIKSNTSARFAFRVTDRTDSLLMIDALGANELLGWGDMMFYLSGQIGRYQGAFISGSDSVKVKQYCQTQAPLNYMFLPSELDKKGSDGSGVELDEYFADVARYVVYEGKCSMNAISQKFSIGFNRANAIVASLEYYGIVSENQGTKARQILVTEDEIESRLQAIGVK